MEILEESDGWMLVRDPSGNQGLVPTSYLQLDHPTPGPTSPGGRGGAPARQGSHHSREPTAVDLFEGGCQQGWRGKL